MGVIIPDGISAQGRWIGRCATNYAVTPYTFARMSFGQGYRFPTLTERFVTTTFGNFSIFSNPGLQSETGWTYEIGLKQMFALGSFKPKKVGNIRISGYEVSVIGQATLVNIPIQILTGYTYIDPIYKDFETNEQIRNSVSESVNILKYRARHQIKCDMEADFGRVRFGASWQYTSHIVNIDKAFESVPPINFDLFGLREYRDINDSGFHLLDCRVIFEFKPLSITLLANNILNSEYSLRPALLEAPRHVGIRCDVEI